MLIIPFSAELSLARKPYVTFVIVALCLLIHYAQDANRRDVARHAYAYCGEAAKGEGDFDPFVGNAPRCAFVLESLHGNAQPGRIYAYIRSELEQQGDLGPAQQEKIIAAIRRHYEDFSITAPRSLDRALVYDPATLNPVKMITSTFAHGDWMHVVGNMIFYLAFAPALELLVGGSLRYLLIIASIIFTTGLVYTLSTLISGDPVPTLGYSGVVTGMIGLSAFMMPRARIRTFVWVLLFVRVIHVPAWLLALWYIGLDAWQLWSEGNGGGVNLVAHVSGGVAGYLIGFFFLKQRRGEVMEELDDEVENMRRLRKQRQGAALVNRVDLKRQENERLAAKAAADHAAFLDRLYRAVNTNRDSEAVMMALALFERYGETVEACEEVYQELKKWRPSRTLLCAGRLAITLQLQQQRFARALRTAEECLDISELFVVGDVRQLALLVQHAAEAGDYRLAYRLLKDADQRYGRTVNHFTANLNAAKLLWLHLGEREKARELLSELRRKAGNRPWAELDKFIAFVESEAG